MKKQSLALMTVLVVSVSGKLNAQLYSSGNNSITGNRVGIGTSTPSAILEIENSYNPNGVQCVGCPPLVSTPSLRMTTQIIGAQTPTEHSWAIQAQSSLIFERSTNGGTASQLLKINPDYFETLTDESELSNVIHVNRSSNASYLNLGVKRVNSNWIPLGGNTAGASIISTSSGSIRFQTGCNGSSSISNAMTISNSGNVGIGTTNPSSALEVSNGDVRIESGRLVVANASGVNEFEVASNGFVTAREILVDVNAPIPDYVFDDSYDLMPLSELRTYIASESHLPNIPSASEVKDQGGIELGEFSRLLLEKQEELVLYILQLEERINSLENLD